MSATRYFSTIYKLRWLVVGVALTFLLSGCGVRIYGTFFGDTHLYKNTKLDHKLLELIPIGCPKIPPQSKYDEARIEMYKALRIKIFDELFPKGTPIATILNDLKASDANCQTQSERNIHVTNCVLTKESILGVKFLYLTGWEVKSAGLLKSSFEYRFTHQDNAISNLSVNIIECDDSAIDPVLYQNSKTIKPIRSVK
jgi:hypothetical protein